MDNDLPTAREFRLAPELIRCGMYITAGCFLIGCVAIAVGRFLPAGPQRAVVSMWLAAVLGMLPWHWRLRVDTRGIARRRFLCWDLWPWDDFAAERLKFGYGDRCFVDPARPFWRRELSLAMLTKCDSDVVWKWIALVWQPAETTVPEVRVGNLLKQAVRCDRSGIELGSGTRQQRFQWTEVILLEVEKVRHDRPGFRRLTFQLPSVKLVFFRNQQNGIEGRTWSGAEPDVIARYLLAHVPENRQVVIAREDEPITPRELDVRLTQARGKLREFKRRCWFLGALVVAMLGWFAFNRDWRFVAFLGFVVLQYSGVFWFIYRGLRDSLRKLEAFRFAADKTPKETRADSDAAGFSSSGQFSG